ncbi:MAG: 16S rRNA (adenine(1518)-N(6)/adenine(1519)-N(6))-dimethyltransferase RsmA [Chloroflexi bacterium]|nr:16S rRNA (adenine(1518)-N(6)/adenine(1519)-N(6))-dimethyltransferase RsmA [Chloroflexota bacterium]
MKAESLLTQTKRLLRRFDLRARKGLGQHFLIDEEVLKLVASSAELIPSDIVIEVGSGLGVLTRELARQAGRLFAVELDSKLAAILKKNLASFSNVTVINEDILKIDPEAVLHEEQMTFPTPVSSPFSYKIVANLPYYITSPVLRHFLEASLKPRLMVVMVQKEVAEAIVAGSGQMSVLSVSVQFYGQPEIISYVPARCFYPAPEVDSAILRVMVYSKPAVDVSEEDFFRLVRAGFTASRKQLCNSLSQGLKLPKAEVLSILEQAGIVPKRRAETLTLEEWANLWRVFTQLEEGR